MATLVLTAVGTLVGGPVGGAIGALVGQAADARIFAPGRREGPRLGELAVQTSSYGSAIPKMFGTMRVAGTVIWSTDLVEQRTTGGGGKGQPKTTSYSYSASFAVALSGRPIVGVGRIWADGKLLRGAAGDFKTATGFRLHHGSEAQQPDPLIASLEGIGATPAYRGIAYAVFEHLQLEDFGNRIPSLTFEVIADPAPVAAGAIAASLSGGGLAAGDTPTLGGYAATGDTLRSAIETLAEAAQLSLVDRDEGLRLEQAGEAAVTLREEEMAAPPEIGRRSADAIASEVTMAYYDVDRDYQTGLQRAAREGAGMRSERRALAAALSAERAKGFAERRLAALWAGRSTARVETGWRHSLVRPGDLVRLEGRPGQWKVERWTLGAMRAALELVRLPGGPAAETAESASPGRPIGHRDKPHGATVLRLHDLPLPAGTGDRPALLALAAGTEAGWRRAELSASFDGGASWSAAGTSRGAAVLGTAVNGLGDGGASLFDEKSEVEVELLNEAMWLESRSDAALVGGANLALLGDELIQFGRAEPTAPRRFRLSRLLRGRRGTEWATGLHEAGESFALIEDGAMTIEAPAGSIGAEARLTALGIGDMDGPAEAVCIVTGASLRPPSPVHLAAREESGDLHLSWVRRSRQGWSWTSGSDTPLGEEAEVYLVVISGPGFERRIAAASPACVYGAAERLADGNPAALTIAVTQIGTFAASRPAQLTLVM